MIPVEPFNNPTLGSREYNAVAKATKDKPEVVFGGSAPTLPGTSKASRSYYRVADKYTVEVYCDPDSQFFVDCNCLAGSPPIDEATGLPSREAVPCYHAAAVLISIAEKEENNVES